MTDRQNPTGGRTPSPDGVEIAYDVAGSGDPALVFVHGWAGNRHHWDGQLDRFAGITVSSDLTSLDTVSRVRAAGNGR